MQQLHAVIEITNDKIRLIAGYVIENEPVIIYSDSKDIKGKVQNNLIVDKDAVVTALKQITFIENKDIHLRIKITEATIILPPVGFSVGVSTKTTNVVSASSIVEPIDINNAVNLVQKDVVSDSVRIVDIIPKSFTIQNGTSYYKPPLGAKSNTIEIHANIHTMPKDIVDSYLVCFAEAGIKVTGTVVSTYALSTYATQNPELPKSYLLVDMGHAMTAFSCIGKGYPYGTQTISQGIDALISRVADSFGISKEEALDVLNLYGIDHRETTFHPAIITSVDEYGAKTNFSQENLNTVIIDYLNDYFAKFVTPMEILFRSTGNSTALAKQLPLIFTGSLIRIPGVKELIKEKFIINKSVSFLRSETIGASQQNYCACVGGLLIAHDHSGSLTNVENKVGPLTRS